MSLESDFEIFKEEVLKKSQKIAEDKIKEAKEIYKQKIHQAQKEGRKYFESQIREIDIQIEKLKKEKISKVEIEFKKEIGKILENKKNKILEKLKQKLDKDFEKLGKCFLDWLKKNYQTGNLKVYKEFSNIKNQLQSFKVKEIEEKKIIFETEQIHIEFSIDSILKEFNQLIEKEIYESIEA